MAGHRLMRTDETLAGAGVPGASPSVSRRKRSGQTAIEYLLVTASMLFVFVMMYRALQYSVANQFKRGGLVIMRVYVESQ